MNLLDIFVRLKLDKESFISELNDAVNEAESAGEKIEESGKKGGDGFASKLASFSSGISSFGGKMSAAGAKLREFSRDTAIIGESLTNNVTKPALNAAKSLAKVVLGKGLERMNTLTEAKNKLRVLGVEGEHLNKTMEIIGNTVDGTAYSTAEFANTAAQAVSMGYDESSGLPKYLQTVSNLAAFTGRDVEQISSITAKVASQNKLTGESFQQLSDAAVPILQWVQEEYDVTAEEARKMVSDGEISFADYENMVEKHLGGMAQAVGDSTLQGALSSTEAYIARLGAAFLGSEDNAKSFAGQLLPLVNEFNDWLVSMGDKAGEIGAIVGEVFGAVVEYIRTGNTDLSTLSGTAQTIFGVIQPIIDAGTKIVEVGQKIFETLGPEKTGMIIAAILGAGPILSLIAGIVGKVSVLLTVGGTLISTIGTFVSFVGSTLIPILGAVLTAIGPIGIAFLAVATAIGLAAAYIYKHWDEIKEKVADLKDKLSETWDSIKKSTVSKVSSMVSSVVGKWNSLRAKASAVWNAIKSAIISPIQTAKARAVALFEGIKSGIAQKIQAAKDKVKSVIEGIKNLFPFSIGKLFTGWFPKIKLGVSKSGNSAETTSSTSQVSFAKAMNQPYVFRRPTEFYAGEAGDEMLLGRTALQHDLKQAVSEADTGRSGDVFNIYLDYSAGDDANTMLVDIARGVKRYKMAGVI